MMTATITTCHSEDQSLAATSRKPRLAIWRTRQKTLGGNARAL